MSNKTKARKQIVAVSQNGYKRAVLYARVSTDEQAEKGYSLPSQVDACRRYAEQCGFTIVGDQYYDLKTGKVVPTLRDGAIPAYVDDYTGTKLDRPGLERLRAMIDRKEVDAVIVFASDRLSRKLAHVLVLREEFQRTGVELHFVNRGKSEDTPESRMTENIEGVFNEYWREKILESSRRGKISKAKSGRAMCEGKPPYGYAYSDGHFAIVESEAEIVRLIFRWYTKGDGESCPMPLLVIARKLTHMNIETPGVSRKKKRKRAANMWNYVTIDRILANETYAGIMRWGKHDTQDGKWKKRPMDETIAIPVPAIVDRQTWEAAQQQKVYNKRMSKRNAKREYLLRGMVICECKHAMVGLRDTKNQSIYRYRCASRFHFFPELEAQPCKSHYVRGDILDFAVWERFVMGAMADRDKFEQALLDAQAKEQAEIQPKRDRLNVVNKLIADVEQEAHELVETLPGVKKGGLISKAIDEKASQLESQHTALCKERDDLQRAVATRKLTNERVKAAMQFREDVMVGMENPTFEDKRRILELLQTKVEIKGKQATVTGLVPTCVIDLQSP